MIKSKKILVWFRNDLRLHDNEMLIEAMAKSDLILPVYIIDPRQFELTPYHSLKTGSIRAQFLLESIAALRQSLIRIGGNLLIRTGLPEEILPQLVEQYEINEVYHHREVAEEETRISVKAEDALWKLQVNLRHFIGHTLYNKEDLPFPIKDIPDVFNQFKKKAERDAIIKPCFMAPEHMEVLPDVEWGTLPDISELGLERHQRDERAEFDFAGGEEAGLQLLEDLVSRARQGEVIKNNHFESRISAWLSLGCVSPRKVYWEIKELEDSVYKKVVFNPVVSGLLWRDYFRFMFKKYGNTYFKPEGFSENAPVVADNQYELLEKWKNGQTDCKTVNTIMNELNQTGYISNSARQTTALYLIYNLSVNWVLGAAYFEEKLIDYCPASNWGNWANMAGVGNDPKGKKPVDLDKLMKSLDPKGDYKTKLFTPQKNS